ncbi:hypothetical protein CK203_110394 [Vitis vinifera]|uniref:Uncharacterized protein n=1 Tax=Vitis vinifera TaxID=29760 RepID=A0A438BPK4_VITVI|nr:hypothetical protein CK203_110394 [Vitis vinifera]
MEEAKTMKTPMSSSIKLDKDEKGMSQSALASFLSISACPRREPTTAFRTQGKRPAKPSQPKARRKARFYTTLFGSVKDYQCFYSRATYGMGGSIISTVRGVEIHLNPESICRIFDILSIRLGVYESKMWPIMPGFEPREAIQRICGLPDAKGWANPQHTA